MYFRVILLGLWHCSCPESCFSKSCRVCGKSYRAAQSAGSVVSIICGWQPGCYSNGRRSGAQRGAPEYDFGQRLISGAPCILTRRSTQGPPPKSGQNQLLSDSQSDVPQKP